MSKTQTKFINQLPHPAGMSDADVKSAERDSTLRAW